MDGKHIQQRASRHDRVYGRYRAVIRIGRTIERYVVQFHVIVNRPDSQRGRRSPINAFGRTEENVSIFSCFFNEIEADMP